MLGYDYLRQARLTVNFGKRGVTLKQTTYVLRSPKAVTVTPLSETIVWSKLSGNRTSGLAVLQPSPKMIEFGLTIAGALITIDEQKPWVPIRVLNPFSTPVWEHTYLTVISTIFCRAI